MVEKKKYEVPQVEVIKLEAAVRICSSSVTQPSTPKDTEEYEVIDTTNWWN